MDQARGSCSLGNFPILPTSTYVTEQEHEPYGQDYFDRQKINFFPLNESPVGSEISRYEADRRGQGKRDPGAQGDYQSIKQDSRHAFKEVSRGSLVDPRYPGKF